MQKLLSLLGQVKPGVDFAAADRLMDDGILDSIDIVMLVGELNDAYGVRISLEHLTPGNFNTPSAMLALIEKLRR